MKIFITRNENGVLQQNLAEWDEFKERLFSLAKNASEMEFLGQLVEDLQFEYDEKMDELENEE